jgi:hypothetical protein
MKVRVKILDYFELQALEEQIKQRRQPANKDGYESWKKYDKAIRDVLKKFGKVGWDDDVDFYHGGDWFHELYDGFALKNSKALSIELLAELHQVVSKFHADAIFELGADLGTPLFGLEIVVIAEGIFAGWYKYDAAECRRKLKELKVSCLI